MVFIADISVNLHIGVPLQGEATHSGANSQSQPSLQDSSIALNTGEDSPPNKKPRLNDKATDRETKGKIKDYDEPRGTLVPLSESAATFLEATFTSKLDNATRVSKAKGHRIPDSW